MYKLLACDLDGTLMDETLVFTPRVKAAVSHAMARGVAVTIATGRAYPSALPFAQELGVTLPLICTQGGLVQDPTTGEVLHRAVMSLSLAHEIIALSLQRGWHLTLYMDDQVYLTGLQYPRFFYDQMFSLPLRVVDDLAVAITRPPDKFIIIAESEAANAIVPELRKRFDGRLRIVRSHRNFVEGNPLDASKGQALARLATQLGIPQSQTAAIGDNDNDADMIAWAGLGMAMGNAHPDLKAIADVILPPVEQDGVAVAIEKYILK
jgi:Cof subfamily protein (haloacid dehalogenase superfamily)